MRTFILLSLLLYGFALRAQETDTLATDDSSRVHRNNQRKDRRFSTGLEAGGGMSYRRVNAERYPELVNCRSHHEQPVASANLALRFRYALSNHFELVSGVSCYQTGFNFTEEKQLSDTLDQEFVLGCEIGFIKDPRAGLVGAGFYDPRYLYMISGLHPDHGTMHVELRYNYLELPLLLKAQIGKKRTRGFIAAGGDVNYLAGVTQRMYFTNEITTFGTFETYRVHSMYRRWNFGVQAAMGVEQMITESLSVGLQASGKYQLRSIIRYDDYRENHFAGWVSAGLYYHFGKSAA